MFSVLTWIPVIGPIIDGLVKGWNKYQDTALGKYREDTKVDIETIKASTQIIEATKDDIGVRLARDIVIYPPAIWSALTGWDTIMAIPYPDLMWHVADYPNNVAYIPGAVFTFLLGNIALNVWRRK